MEQLSRYAEENAGLWRKYPPRERPLLIEPYVQEDYTPHLHPETDGRLRGLSDRARATIDHFELNRAERVSQRRAAYQQNLAELRKLLTSSDEDALRSAPVFDFPALPFGGTWYLYLRRLAVELARREGGRPVLSRARINAFLMRMQGRSDALQALDAASETIERDDDADLSSIQEPLRPRRSTARLTSVRITNYRGLESLEFNVGAKLAPELARDLPTPALLILGENAAGKSSILEAVALTLSGRLARAALDLEPRKLRLDPAYMGDESRSIADRAEVELSFNDGGTRFLVIDQQGMTEGGREDLPPVFAYGAFRQYTTGCRRYGPERAVVSLFRTDKLLSNPEAWLLRLKPAAFNMVVRTLRDILSVEGEFDVIRRDPRRRRCLVVTATRGPAGDLVHTQTPLALVSSGFRAVLAMVCDIMEGLMDARVSPQFESFSTVQAVVLIDEIEAHLHPRWKLQILRGLRTALPGATFIGTTHDPLCLRGLADGEALVLHRIPGEETEKTSLPVHVERLTGLPDLSQLTVQQLLTSDFFSMSSTDSPETEQDLARIADLLALGAAGRPLGAAEASTLLRFDRRSPPRFRSERAKSNAWFRRPSQSI